MKYLTVLTFLFFVTPCFSFEGNMKVSDPIEVREEIKSENPEDIKGLEWNRWTSKSFVVCSINNDHAKYLNKNLEEIKSSLYHRWGMYDINFKAECRLICVGDEELFYKLFRLRKSKIEVRRNEDGSLKMIVGFFLLNKSPADTIPEPLTEICLLEMEEHYEINFRWWTHRGMAGLNGTLESIRQKIDLFKNKFNNNEDIYFSEGLLNMTQDKWNALDEDKKMLFDQEAIILCLMLKKEFGTTKFQVFMKDSADSPFKALESALKFKDYDDFDRSFKRYISDLMNSEKIPDSYLQVN